MTIAKTPYAVGHSEAELDRLASQSRFLGDLTEQLLRQAGLKPGMRVLDIGCGAGDVTFLAARLVGPDGFVTGIDQSAEAVERAEQRAREAGLGNVAFVVGDAGDLLDEPIVDAVIGRLVVMYVPDASEFLRRLSQCLKPGGIMVFQELDMAGRTSLPPAPLLELTGDRVQETLSRLGANVRTGLDLYRIFREAGLPAPRMIQAAPVAAGPDSEFYEQLASVVRTLLPHIERLGLASRAEIDIDTLADRLRDEAVTLGSVAVWPPLIGAWATAGG
jgi:ubiquinone/menaquinone biosynthesis C-methylase UbiE